VLARVYIKFGVQGITGPLPRPTTQGIVLAGRAGQRSSVRVHCSDL